MFYDYELLYNVISAKKELTSTYMKTVMPNGFADPEYIACLYRELTVLDEVLALMKDPEYLAIKGMLLCGERKTKVKL